MSAEIRAKRRCRWLRSIAIPAALLVFVLTFYITTLVLCLTVPMDR